MEGLVLELGRVFIIFEKSGVKRTRILAYALPRA